VRKLGESPAAAPTRDLLTMTEFARRLGISVWTARSWAYKGRIASVKLGARLQVPAAEIERLVLKGLRPARCD
jgi:excisionase family DNA binding protein